MRFKKKKKSIRINSGPSTFCTLLNVGPVLSSFNRFTTSCACPDNLLLRTAAEEEDIFFPPPLSPAAAVPPPPPPLLPSLKSRLTFLR